MSERERETQHDVAAAAAQVPIAIFFFFSRFFLLPLLLFISPWLDLLVFGGNFSAQLFPFGQDFIGFRLPSLRFSFSSLFRCHFSAALFFICQSFVFIFILIAILIPPPARLLHSFSWLGFSGIFSLSHNDFKWCEINLNYYCY